jgi:hypothetical protein
VSAPAGGFRHLPRLGLALALATALPAPLAAQQVVGLTVDPSGDVGIGTSTPQAELHVVGDALVAGIVQGQGYQGYYGNSALIQGFSALGTTSLFTIYYDDITYGNTPQAIQIGNVGTNVFKTFVIDHPERGDRYLVHATLEGPEGAVFYRGAARLEAGLAVVELPPYFEALTRQEGRTVLLTNVDGFDRLAVQTVGGARVRDGRFVVRSDDPASTQAFDWEVKAVRADSPRLVVEPRREEIEVRRFGPYTFAVPRQ